MYTLSNMSWRKLRAFGCYMDIKAIITLISKHAIYFFLSKRDNSAIHAKQQSCEIMTFSAVDLAYANDSFLFRPTMLL